MRVRLRIFSVLFLISIFVLPATSRGHAFPSRSDPKVGSKVSGSPASVSIWFDADLEPAFSTISVQDSQGKTVDKKDSHTDPSDPKLLQVSLEGLPPGKYKVLWDVVARDGHRTNGDFTFEIK